MLDVGEHEGGFRDVADAAGTDGDVPQDPPATHISGCYQHLDQFICGQDTFSATITVTK